MQLLQKNNNNKKAQYGFLESAFPSHVLHLGELLLPLFGCSSQDCLQVCL